MEVLTGREIADKFFDKHLMVLKSKFNNDEPWYVDLVNYIVGKVVPPNWTFEKRKRFFSQVKTYFWEEPYAFKLCADNIMRRCVAGSETLEILADCHSGPTGGHHSANITAKKVYESGFYWPSVFKDANEYVRRCDVCQRSRNISSRNEMPQNNIQVCEVFDVWGLDFMGPFTQSRGNKYILVALDYVSKWVKAQALPTNDARVVVKFLRQLFARFGVPKALICDRGTYFCNSKLEKALQRYGVTHKLSTAYHPQSNGQTKVTNMAIKCILERSVGYNPKGWSEKLNDALWAFRTAYKTPTGCTPFRLVYGKACHLPVEIEHFKVGDQVLLYNSRLKMYPGKLKSKWSGPNIVKMVYPHGAIEITDKDEFSFKANGQRLKKYYRGKIDKDDDEVIEFENGVTIAVLDRKLDTPYPMEVDTPYSAIDQNSTDTPYLLDGYGVLSNAYNNMASGSKDRPTNACNVRESQWRSRFLRNIDTKTNGEFLRNNLTVDKMQVNVQFLQQLQPEWSSELRALRIAKNANPLALVATAQPHQDPYYQTTKSHKSYAPTSKASLPTRSHATTRHKGKEIAKPITPLSESPFDKDIDPKQAQKDKEMQKNLALIAKYFKKLYKPTNNNLRTSSNTRNKNVDTTPRKPKRVKDSMYHKKKMLLCKQAKKGVQLQAEQSDWLADTDEKIDKQELEAHYIYMAKI
ncbi:reverse transcriptase domain-containing protein [Tanacetum coccineum]